MVVSFLTRRLFVAACLVPLVAATATAAGGDTGATGEDPVEGPLPRRAFARAARTKTLTVGYFGGSITEGAGASNAAKTSWRALTTAYLTQNLPGVTVTAVNAAIGGTGSNLGAFRLHRDLLDHKPDLVFVEFAVNDFGRPEPSILRTMEGIVRAIYRANPETDIVFVYTATKAMDDAAYAKGLVPTSVAAHRRIAAHYHIPEVNIGEALTQAVHKDYGGDWLKLTGDNVHPNDTGYALYTDRLTAFLNPSLEGASKPLPPVPPLPKSLTDCPLENGRMLDAWDLPSTDGWEKDPKTLSGRFPHRLSASKPGTELRIPFSGDAVGLYWLIAPDSGDMEWSLDGSPWKRASSWDKYALKFTRANSVLLSDTLTPGKHELVLRIAADKNPESTGTFLRIGAILVNETK